MTYADWHVERPSPGVDPGDPAPLPARCPTCGERVIWAQGPERVIHGGTDGETTIRASFAWRDENLRRHECF